MRRVGIVSALALALTAMACATPVNADPFESYQEVTLQTCVSGAGTDVAALRTCIGAGANPCIATDGEATSSYVLCWSHEAESWRALMDQAGSELSERAAYRDPQRLQAASAAWEAWLDAECEYWAWQEGGGSGEQVERVQCAARLTAERAITLIAAER